MWNNGLSEELLVVGHDDVYTWRSEKMRPRKVGRVLLVKVFARHRTFLFMLWVLRYHQRILNRDVVRFAFSKDYSITPRQHRERLEKKNQKGQEIIQRGNSESLN